MSALSRCALIVVDMQHDFMPNGALAVTEGDLIVDPARRVLESSDYGCVVATQDWHPAGHVSFATSHEARAPFETIEPYGHEQTLWPDHCVQRTPGAALHEGLPLDVLWDLTRSVDPADDAKVEAAFAERGVRVFGSAAGLG